MKYFVALLLIMVLLLLSACGPKPPAKIEAPDVVPPDDLAQNCPLTGSPEAHGGLPVLLVVDNHPQARPQDGLEWADILYEVPVEGGLTRFVGLWSRPIQTAIGPIRSGRPYFAHLALEHGTPLLHHGQSATFRSVVTELGVSSLSLESSEHPIWRDAGRNAPHNLYTSLIEVQELVSKVFPYYDRYVGKELPFSQDTTLGSTRIVELLYPSQYHVSYVLNDEGSYSRFSEGEDHGFAVENVIVQITVVRDQEEGSADLVGVGVAYLFTRGQALSGTWRKASVLDQTHFFDGTGMEWELTPGRTIVHIVPLLTSVTYR